MNNEEKEKLKALIKEKFKLEGIGVEVSFFFTDKPPQDAELKKNKGALKLLGKVGRFFVWLIWGTFGLVQVYVTTMDIPEAVEKHRIHYPKSYNVAVQIIEQAKSGLIFSHTPTGKTTDSVGEGYIIVNPIWLKDEKVFNKEKEMALEGTLFSNPDHNSILVYPTSGANITSSNTITYSSSLSATSDKDVPKKT